MRFRQIFFSPSGITATSLGILLRLEKSGPDLVYLVSQEAAFCFHFVQNFSMAQGRETGRETSIIFYQVGVFLDRGLLGVLITCHHSTGVCIWSLRRSQRLAPCLSVLAVTGASDV